MLRIENIAKTFNPGTITEKVALTGLSLHLAPGEFVTVIGGNGAGKSTLMNSITAAGMMIEENLAIAERRGRRPTLAWSSSEEKRQEYRELLLSLGLGLEDRLESKVGLLSGGQRQALTLLMATMASPKLLLLDEHTAALDPKTAAQVLRITKTIVEGRNLTTLMITHNMRDALALGNRLIMMYEGRILIDVAGEEKKRLTVPDLLKMFEQAAGSEMTSDSLLLS